MRKQMIYAAAFFLLAGCNSYKHFMGQDHEGSGADNPGAVHTNAASGLLPASNSLMFTPALDNTETLSTVKVRISGVLTDITSTPSGGTYYTFDGTTLTIINYDAAANIGGFSDNFAVYFLSSRPAGYHTVS